MSARSTVFVFCLGLVFVWGYAARPLWHTDLWDHANYGKHILHNGIPDTEPLLELAKGTTFVATEWLSQATMAVLLNSPSLGLPALQFGHALLVLIAMAAVCAAVYRRNRSVCFAIAAALVFVAVNWQQLLIIRPQLAGVTCFCILTAALVSRAASQRCGLILLPAMFVVWANCHGSFAMGLMLIGLSAAGRTLDVLARTKSVRPTVINKQARKLVWLMLLSLVAASVNPFGIEIFAEVARVGSHPNIATMFEWDPMSLKMKQGKAMAASVVVIVILMCVTPRRVTIEECLRLIVTGGLALWSARMINWFAPIVAISLGIHGHAAFDRLRNYLSNRFRFRGAPNNRRRDALPPRSGFWTIANLILVSVFVGLTPFGKQVLGIRKPDVSESVSAQTPVAVATFLAHQDNLLDGLTFVPAEWTGYIMHAAPDSVRPFVNLHVHVIPVDIWSDYVRIIRSPGDAASILTKYNINTIVADRFRQRPLIRQLSNNREFHRLYEDHQSIVFRRGQPIE